MKYAPPLPKGKELGQLIRQLWKEQERTLLNTMRLYGPQAVESFDPQRWFQAFYARITPVYDQYLSRGRELMQNRIAERIGRKKSAAPQPDHDMELEEVFGIYNRDAVEFANQYAYYFALSTNSTTRMRLDKAYEKFRQQLIQGIEEGESLRKLTADIMRIFRDPQRAMMIAASEVSRAYHAGQEIAAQESGVVAGKRWLASSDACEQCLALNGKEVPIGSPFIVLPGGGQYARVDYPPLHPKCMCSMTEVLTDEWKP